jgi:DNA mismatch repair protein MutS
MPAGLIRQARHTLEALENASSARPTHRSTLFGRSGPGGAPRASSSATRLEEALAAIQPDALSPREALDALYRLKELQGRPA